MPVVLAIETSTRVGSVAARLGAEDRFAELAEGRAHGADLMPAVADLVRGLGAAPRDLAAVLVGTGPGSYTGLRVGIATAISLAWAARAEARGVPSGEILAYGALEPGEVAHHLIDGRSGGFYVARFRRVEREVEVLEPPDVVARADLASRLAGASSILTDASTLAAAALPPELVARARTDARPGARALLELGLARLGRLGPEPLESIRPLYLRAFGARS